MDSNTITAYSTLVLAIVTIFSVFFVAIQAYLIRKQSEQETNRRQLQAITQLDGGKTELLDIHMSLIQMKLDCEKYKILRYRFAPDSEEEKRVINEEYARERQFADNRIIDATKSFGHLVETLSAIEHLFGNVPEIEIKIKNIINNEYLFKNIIEGKVNQFNIDINRAMDNLVANLPKGQKIQGEQLQTLMDKNKEETANQLFNWIIVNFINPIDNLSDELKKTLENKDSKEDQDAPGYNDTMYEKIKADLESNSPVLPEVFDINNEDKAPLDNLLQSLAKFVEYQNVELPITLFIKGTIVSGMLIGHTAFYNHFEKQIRSLTSSTPEGADRIKQMADGLKRGHEENIKKLEKLSPREKDAKISGTRYIYLKDAEIVNSNGPNMPLGPVGLLRTRTNSIDSFSIGAIRSSRRQL